VVSTTPRPLYPRQWLSTHFTGDWVGLGTRLDDKKNLADTGIRSPDRPYSRYNDGIIPVAICACVCVCVCIHKYLHM